VYEKMPEEVHQYSRTEWKRTAFANPAMEFFCCEKEGTGKIYWNGDLLLSVFYLEGKGRIYLEDLIVTESEELRVRVNYFLIGFMAKGLEEGCTG